MFVPCVSIGYYPTPWFDACWLLWWFLFLINCILLTMNCKPLQMPLLMMVWRCSLIRAQKYKFCSKQVLKNSSKIEYVFSSSDYTISALTKTHNNQLCFLQIYNMRVEKNSEQIGDTPNPFLAVQNQVSVGLDWKCGSDDGRTNREMDRISICRLDPFSRRDRVKITPFFLKYNIRIKKIP